MIRSPAEIVGEIKVRRTNAWVIAQGRNGPDMRRAFDEEVAQILALGVELAEAVKDSPASAVREML